jgi:opacity protein-like surface antigen
MNVMKSVFLSLSFCLLVAAAVAQSTAPKRNPGSNFYFGGGPTFSRFTGDGADDNTSVLVGAQVAAGMVWQLSNNFSIVPELNVSMQGTKAKVISDYTVRLWYLNLPVQVRYNFAGSGFFVETGPQIGLLLDAKRIQNDVKTDADDAVKETSINWNFGLGYNINKNIAINARIAPGLNDIAESPMVDQKQLTGAFRILFSF